MIKRRILYGAIGLAYGVVVGFWAILLSGGGHFNLPGMLIISPVWRGLWLGLLFWPIWAFMAADFHSFLSKCVFLLSMIAHFAGIIVYVSNEWENDLYWFKLAMQEPTFFPIAILFPGSVVVLYLAAHLFLWCRFFIDTFGQTRRRQLGDAAARSINAAT